MADTYTQSFNIPSGGWTGQATALMYAGAAAAATGLTATVILWRDAEYVGNTYTYNTPVAIAMMPGAILPLKVKYISYAGATGTFVTGFN